ncbi:MAG: imidazole glycerol phosphate synthase subunit HisH [Pelagibacteraceae bacterium TMED124]|nr:MAG: imidazole glycerol phosphate synthase subunit HisH [Pelagibacteraceae bacterium TMED124]|tara:strand:- start:14366 stop:14983 length:618 start_codon:yes stop_codon:yes gene_type:complete
MIGIIDYGLGNIRAFSNIYKSLNIEYRIVKKSEELKDVSKIILPGVGAFDDAMNKFNISGLRDGVEKMILNNKIPLLGVCVGMQMLAESSDEGSEKGLGWINSSVKIFDAKTIKNNTKLPHMGWNTIDIISKNEPLFKDLEQESSFYFLHSYYFDCKDKKNIISETEYGNRYTSAVRSDNIYGVQFHPEKSHKNGITLLNNFSNL